MEAVHMSEIVWFFFFYIYDMGISKVFDPMRLIHRVAPAKAISNTRHKEQIYVLFHSTNSHMDSEVD